MPLMSFCNSHVITFLLLDLLCRFLTSSWETTRSCQRSAVTPTGSEIAWSRLDSLYGYVSTVKLYCWTFLKTMSFERRLCTCQCIKDIYSCRTMHITCSSSVGLFQAVKVLLVFLPMYTGPSEGGGGGWVVGWVWTYPLEVTTFCFCLRCFVMECDQLSVNILSVHDIEENVMWRACTTMKTIADCRK